MAATELPRIEVVCDACHQPFEAEVRATPTPSGGEVLAMHCPCGMRYDVAYVPPRALRAQRELQAVRASLALREDGDQRRRMWKLQDEIKHNIVLSGKRK